MTGDRKLSSLRASDVGGSRVYIPPQRARGHEKVAGKSALAFLPPREIATRDSLGARARRKQRRIVLFNPAETSGSYGFLFDRAIAGFPREIP